MRKLVLEISKIFQLIGSRLLVLIKENSPAEKCFPVWTLWSLIKHPPIPVPKITTAPSWISWSTRNGISGLLQRVQEALETDKEYTGIEIFEMANKGNEKVIKGNDAFAKEVATQIFNVHIIFDCEKVAIGGGISAQPLLIELINKNLDESMNI